MNISFVNGINSVTVETPQFGYISEVSLPFHYSKLANNQFKIWDDGKGAVTYDRRYANIEFMVDASDIGDLNGFFSDATKGRGEAVDLVLGVTPTGFFPFLPDKGDVGTFPVRVIEYNQSPQLWNPFKWWSVKMKIFMQSAPSYSIISGTDEGVLQIGTIEGLQYPQGGYDSETEYSINNVVTMNADVHEIDMSPTADKYRSVFSLYGNTGKTGALIDHLVVSVRNAPFTIIVPTDHYLYGYDKGDSGSYGAQLLESKISVTHLNYNNFRTDLKINFISLS